MVLETAPCRDAQSCCPRAYWHLEGQKNGRTKLKHLPISYLHKIHGASAILLHWILMPILGKISAPLFLLLIPFQRSRRGHVVPELRAFFLISAAYSGYIIFRSLVAGANAEEPIGDTLPLIVVAGLSLWVVRRPMRLDMSWLFCAACLMLALVFVLAVFERNLLGVLRPELLLGNPLNLAPLLLMPCILVTIREFAPNQRWMWFGLLSFCLGGYVIGGLAQSRGIFLGWCALGVLRAFFEVFSPAMWRSRLKTSSLILLAIGFVVTLVAVNPATSGRYVSAAETISRSSENTEWSTGLRVTMLAEGWKTFLQRPLFGHGPQNRFDAVFPKGSSFPIQLSHLHNDFLTHGVAGGGVAILLLCLILAAPAWYGLRNNAGVALDIAHIRRQIGVLTTCAFFGVATVNNVFFVSISTYTTALTIVSFLLVLAALRASDQRVSPAS